MTQLALAPLTINDASLPELVSCAAAAGFEEIGLTLAASTPEPGKPLMTASASDLTETARRLADTGVRVLDTWIAGMHPETKPADFEPVFEAGARLGARYVLTLGFDEDEGRTVETFAGLCAVAAPYGLRLAIEFVSFMAIRTIAQAARIVERAGASNGGVLVDALHLSRSGGTPDDVKRVDPKHLFYMQICDAPAQAPGPSNDALLEEAVKDRLYPGEGELPLRELLAALPADIPISVETPCRRHAHEPAAQRALRAAEATRAWLASVPRRA